MDIDRDVISDQDQAMLWASELLEIIHKILEKDDDAKGSIGWILRTAKWYEFKIKEKEKINELSK